MVHPLFLSTLSNMCVSSTRDSIVLALLILIHISDFSLLENSLHPILLCSDHIRQELLSLLVS